MKNQFRILLFFITIIFLTSCNNEEKNITKVKTTQNNQTQSVNHSEEYEIVKTPIIPTRVVTPTLTPQVLILNTQQKMETYTLLFTSCKLPCWWNSVPGRTTTDYLKSIYSSYGLPLPEVIIKTSDDTRLWQVSELSTSGNQLIQQFFFNGKNILVRINIKIANQKRQYISPDNEYMRITDSIKLSAILNRYGKPQNIYLYTSPAAPEGGNIIPYVLILDYSIDNFNVLFSGINKLQGDIYKICPQKAYIEINTWDPFSEITSNMTLWPGAISDLQPIALVSDLDTTKFFQLFSDSSYTGCITTQRNFW